MTHINGLPDAMDGADFGPTNIQNYSSHVEMGCCGFASDYGSEKQEIAHLKRYCETLEKKLSAKHALLCETQESLGVVQADFQTFALAASHDLQAPLRSITGFSQYLKEEYEGSLDDVANDYINRIVANSSKMKRQLAGLSNFAKVSSQAAPFDAACLGEVWETAVVKHEGSIQKHGVAVKASALPVVFGDRVQLETLFANLIENCIKFRGVQTPEISIAANKDEKKWVVEIEDNGVGIPLEQLDCVFKIFRHLDAAKSHRGVGLTVCRRIVQRHSGRIYFCPKKRNGCKLIIELPVWSPP